MNGNSKRERVESFVRQRVESALKERGFDCPAFGSTLREGGHVNSLAYAIAYKITSGYSLQELDDIMHWKKPKRVD